MLLAAFPDQPERIVIRRVPQSLLDNIVLGQEQQGCQVHAHPAACAHVIMCKSPLSLRTSRSGAIGVTQLFSGKRDPDAVRISLCIDIHAGSCALTPVFSVKIMRESFIYFFQHDTPILDQFFCRFQVSLIEGACRGDLVKPVILIGSLRACGARFLLERKNFHRFGS